MLRRSLLVLLLAASGRAADLEVSLSPVAPPTPLAAPAALPQAAIAPLNAVALPEASLPSAEATALPQALAPAQALRQPLACAARESDPVAGAQSAQAALDVAFDGTPTRDAGGATCGHCGVHGDLDDDRYFPIDSAGERFVAPGELGPLLPSAQDEEHWTKETSLHAHSYFSDGTMTPEDVVERAYRQGVRKIALSDHDSVAGVARAYRKAKELGMDFHPAAELTARGGVHVGAVDLDITNSKLTALLGRVRDARYKHAAGMADYLNGDRVVADLEALAGQDAAPERRRGGGDPAKARKALDALREFRSRGGRITLEAIAAESSYAEGGTIEMPHVARALLRNGLIENVDDAFDTFFHTMPQLPNVPPDPTVDEVLAVVHAAGGKAFLNHPYTVRGRDDAEKDRLAYQILKKGFDGIEVYRPSNATSEAGKRRFDERAAKYLTWAEELGLTVGNGADYHGEDTHLNHIAVWMPKSLEAELLKALAPAQRKALEVLDRSEPPAPGAGRGIRLIAPMRGAVAGTTALLALFVAGFLALLGVALA